MINKQNDKLKCSKEEKKIKQQTTEKVNDPWRSDLLIAIKIKTSSRPLGKRH